MQTVELDASSWTHVTDVYGAIYEALGSPYSACNINALLEGLYWDHAFDALNGTDNCASYKVRPPFTIKVVNTAGVQTDIVEQLRLLRQCLAEAHQWFRQEWNGKDVEVEVEFELT